jgi:hypothetical protein
LTKIIFHTQFDVLYRPGASENRLKKKRFFKWKTGFLENQGLWGSISRNDRDIRIQHGRLPMVNYV